MLIRLFVFVGGLIVVALTVALIGPYFIDWTPYRADFEREASRILGRHVTVAGSATARLLPFPSVTFSDVRVAGPDGSAAVMTADRFSMDAELAPFLRGEILIFDMRIVHPKIRMAIDENGTLDLAVRPDTPVNPRQIELENVSISDGEIDITHALSGREHVLSGINATLSARSLAGPWRSQGHLSADGRPVSFQISTGEAGNKGGMRLRMRLKPANYPVAIETDGDVDVVAGKIGYKGRFSVADFRPADASATSAAAAFAVPGAAGTTGDIYRLNGNFALDNARFDISEFRFESGDRKDPYVAQGKAYIDLGSDTHFSITANGQQWRIPDGAGGGTAATVTLQKRLETIGKLVAVIPSPSVPGTVEINLPAIVAGGTTLRDLRLSAKPQGSSWVIESASAKLPGRSTLEARGTLNVGENPAFSGSLLLAVSQPSGFAAWLATDVNDAIRRLPSAGFSANVQLTREKQVFNDLELILGNARFKGHVERKNPPDGEPSVVAGLAGGEVDEESLKAFAAIFSGKSAEKMAGGNLDMQLSAGPVTYAGLTAGTADLALRLRDNTLEVDKLTINDLYGTEISATGTVSNLDKKKPSGHLDASLIAVDLEPLFSKLAENHPGNAFVRGLEKRAAGYPELFGDSRINVIASISGQDSDTPKEAALSANGIAGGTQFSLTATGSQDSLDDPKASFSVSVTASNKDGGRLLALYGLPVLPVPTDRRLETEFNARGNFANGVKVSASFRSDDDTASFSGNAIADAGSVSAKGSLKLETSDIEPWLIATGFAYPGMGIGLPVSLDSAVELDKGVLRFSGLTGKIVDDGLTGDLSASLENGIPKISGAASFDTLAMEPLAMALFGDDAFQAEPGAWPQTAFTLNPLVPALLDLQVKAKSVEGGLAGFVSDADFHLRLDDAGLLVTDFSGSYAGGRLGGRLDAKNNGGTGLFGTQVELQGADVATLFPQTGLAGTIDFSGSFTASGKTVEGFVATLAGTGAAAIHDFSVEGLNTGAFGKLIENADKFGRDIEKADVAEFAIPLVSNGTFHADSLGFPFTIASGVLRTAPLTASDLQAALSFELRADLPKSTAKIDGNLTYDAGREKLVGSDPVVGFSATGPIPDLTPSYDVTGLKQYLVQRALEREQDRVERMQAILLEKQRLRRYVSLFEHEEDMRKAELLRREEEARKAAEEAQKAADEAQKAAEEAQKAQQGQPDNTRPQGPLPDGGKPAKGGSGKQPQDAFPQGKMSLDEFIRSLSR